MTTQPTVFLVDDDAGMRRSTAMLLAAARLPCKAYEGAAAFLEDYAPEQPGCLVLDMSMPGMSGLELIERLRDAGAQLPIVVVSGTGTISTAVRGMKLGVVDYLEKPVDPDVLLARIRAAIELDATRRAEAASRGELEQRVARLTGREREVVQLLVRGLSNKQVAAELNIAAKTVDKHRTSAMQKLEALNAADLSRICVTAGIQ